MKIRGVHAREVLDSRGQPTVEVEVTLEGTVESVTDERGRTRFTLTVGDVTYELSAGPHWYWRDSNPLAAHVGQDVTIVGESVEGSTDVDVRSVNGTEIRARGRPPWAGGWKTVGAQHPGWSEEKSARWGLKFGDCFPPGHCKEKPGKADDAIVNPAGSGATSESGRARRDEPLPYDVADVYRLSQSHLLRNPSSRPGQATRASRQISPTSP